MPDFLIIGAGKAGTTSLYYYLQQHPEIFLSSIKEPKFFSFEGLSINDVPDEERIVYKNSVTSLKKYKGLFKKAPASSIKGEASQRYFEDSVAMKNIAKHLPRVRLIAVLRNPIERAFSLYLHFRRDGREKEVCFDKVIQRARPDSNRYLKGGFYFNILQHYYEHFSPEQIHLILFDELLSSSIDVSTSVFKFLNVRTNFSPDTSMVANISGIPKSVASGHLVSFINSIKPRLSQIFPEIFRGDAVKLFNQLQKKILVKPQMSDWAKKYLRNIYYKDIVELQKMLGKDLSDWLI